MIGPLAMALRHPDESTGNAAIPLEPRAASPHTVGITFWLLPCLYLCVPAKPGPVVTLVSYD